MKTYLYRYRFKGAEYGLEIPADTLEEAMERVRAIQFGRVDYDGVLVAKIPAVTGAWLPDLIVRFRNWIRG